jgi:hypothetical protein
MSPRGVPAVRHAVDARLKPSRSSGFVAGTGGVYGGCADWSLGGADEGRFPEQSARPDPPNWSTSISLKKPARRTVHREIFLY